MTQGKQKGESDHQAKIADPSWKISRNCAGVPPPKVLQFSAQQRRNRSVTDLGGHSNSLGPSSRSSSLDLERNQKSELAYLIVNLQQASKSADLQGKNSCKGKRQINAIASVSCA